jgi:phage gpG-like protein
MDSSQFGKLSGAKLATLERYFQEEGPKMVVRETLRFIDDNFRMQGWQGATFQPWEPNKKGTRILVRKGDLRRGFNYLNRGNGEVEFYNNIIYAGIHNQGGIIVKRARSETFVRNRHTSGKRQGLFKRGTTPGEGFTYKPGLIVMPQRQFAPIEGQESPVLNNDIMKFLEQDIRNILTF